ncbi:MAG: ABC transporter ATP-binding protein [Candidatus Thermoplasmatota archaeon]|nr:ABC transporter ATP-binding protein [Candidatus Thermoplasmatota archaeon]
MILLENVSYKYDDGILALDGASIEIKEGERIALIGPNGAGKSTLLTLIAGLKKQCGGKMKIQGKTGIVFQDPDDQIFMPRVWDDVAFGPINQGIPNEQIEERVNWALESVGMQGFEERAPHHLSFGERKRVAIAGILAMKPNVLLLDEPTANLDPRGVRELWNLLLGLGGTQIIATHDMGIAAKCDRIIIIHKGKAVWSGTGISKEVLEKYDLA